jgi:hypothetical protein
VNGAARGDLSAEKVYVKLAKMTCDQPGGRVAVSEVKGFISFAGKTGVRGRVVSREGSLVSQALLAGVVGGFGRGFSANANSLFSGLTAGADGKRKSLSGADIVQGGLGQGVGDAAAYARGLSTDDRATLSEIASIDLLYAILDQLVSEVGKSKASFIAADEAKLSQWTAQISAARTALADRQQTTQARLTAIMQIIQKTQFLENVLASSLSPGMAASLDWSRAINNRGLN